MARADGAARRSTDTHVSNTGIPAMVYSDLKSSGFFQMAPKVAWAGLSIQLDRSVPRRTKVRESDANSRTKLSTFTSAFHSMTGR